MSLITSVLAQQNKIVLNDENAPALVTPKFAVYWDQEQGDQGRGGQGRGKQEAGVQDWGNPLQGTRPSPAEPLAFNEFKAKKDSLPYEFSNQANFGFVQNGLWFHAKIENQSDIEDWVLSVRFAQINDARLYLVHEGETIYEKTDGILNKHSHYANPTFEIRFEKNQTVDAYLYVSASSMSLLAPIYLEPESAHSVTNKIDFLLWGGFYGTIIILAMYAITFSFNYPSLSNLLFFFHIFVVLKWQLSWSGHSYLLGDAFFAIFNYVRPEEIILLLGISSTAFTTQLLPRKKFSSRIYIMQIGFIVLSIIALALLSFNAFSIEWRFIITYTLGYVCLAVNFLSAFQTFNSQYAPARPILIAWILMVIGVVFSTLYIFGYLSTNTFNSQLFQLALNLQAGAFLLGIVSKTQNELEDELLQARADAENNFLMVEEQNVHLEIARREAVKASEVKSQFLANMSHEIRTPLNAIINFSKELESKVNVAERDEHVKIVNSAAKDLLTLVNDILDFSKMEAGQLTLNEKPFQPRDLFEDIAATMSKTAHLKQLEFIYDVDDLPTFLVGDVFRVKQLLTNLLSNALKFTNYGHVALRAKVDSLTSRECVIRIKVEDSGIGINEQDLDTIFKAFHQLEDELNRSYQGTGLGLVICQELVYLMNGHLSVRSEPTIGSCFEAIIPFKVQSSQQIGKPGILPHSLNSLPFLGRKAFVYDRWGESRRTIVRQLQITGFEVSSFESLDLLIQKLEADSYLFIVLSLTQTSKRHFIIERVKPYAPDNTIVLFSGPPPPNPLISMLPVSTRVVRLPLTARKVTSIDSPVHAMQLSETEKKIKDLPSARILAVDDMELNLRLLETWMKNSPITLDLAYDGHSAIEKCEQIEYDLILMDIQMPGLDGIETTKRIRKLSLNRATPIIAVTAHALEKEKQHFLESGLEDFLSKPIELDSLISLIYEWCDFQDHDSEKLPESIDWDLALSRSNQNPEVAMSFMDDFVSHLNDHRKDIQQYAERQEIKSLLESVHKLHGACCYTGVPRLQMLCFELEEAIKRDPTFAYETKVEELLLEANLLINDWAQRRQFLI
uniref:hybrid sensor histidine kinase/response regulator n=1 Tax=Ningiella ruwaisensis TaxID=2364274 RepID=UPI00144838AF|nr:hybrid sensor histidine kinase/response regulator [Ningiella ruwaisensis]